MYLDRFSSYRESKQPNIIHYRLIAKYPNNFFITIKFDCRSLYLSTTNSAAIKVFKIVHLQHQHIHHHSIAIPALSQITLLPNTTIPSPNTTILFPNTTTSLPMCASPLLLSHDEFKLSCAIPTVKRSSILSYRWKFPLLCHLPLKFMR